MKYTMQDFYNILQECLHEVQVDTFAIMVGFENNNPIFIVRLSYGIYFQNFDITYDEEDFKGSVKTFIQEISQAFYSEMNKHIKPTSDEVQSQNKLLDNNDKDDYNFYYYDSKRIH